MRRLDCCAYRRLWGGSMQQVAIAASTGVPVTVLRAAMLIRSGSGPVRDPALSGAAPRVMITPTLVNTRSTGSRIAAPPSAAFRAVCGVGGARGWHIGWLACAGLARSAGWWARAAAGPARPYSLRYGDALDFWRVVGIERDRSLSLTLSCLFTPWCFGRCSPALRRDAMDAGGELGIRSH